MKLYTYPGACSTANHIVLHWATEPFEIEIIQSLEMKAPEFSRLNPMGQVPVLVDGDLVLNQNAAIMTYIAERSPATRLFGDGGARDRAEAMRWLMLGVADMHAAFAPLFDVLKAPSEALQNERTIAVARTRLRRMFEIADTRLAGREWLAGFRSAADAYMYVMLSWAQLHQIDLADLVHLSAFRARMSQDLGVQAALRTEGLLPPPVVANG
ncbi:MAG TPA: glutathione S-transferase N-terminal domain-containing protein [Lysobacter sp.]